MAGVNVIDSPKSAGGYVSAIYNVCYYNDKLKVEEWKSGGGLLKNALLDFVRFNTFCFDR